MDRQGKSANLTLHIACDSLIEADDEPPPQVKERTRALFPILVGQSCCFALIAVQASGEASGPDKQKHRFARFCGSLGVAAATPYHEGGARMRPITKPLPNSACHGGFRW